MIKLAQQQGRAFFSAFALLDFLGKGKNAGRLTLPVDKKRNAVVNLRRSAVGPTVAHLGLESRLVLDQLAEGFLLTLQVVEMN
jgi:hypothetical protein